VPRCKQPRLQNGYERIEIIESLGAGQAIHAYCLQCDVVWPISAQERFLIARGSPRLYTTRPFRYVSVCGNRYHGAVRGSTALATQPTFPPLRGLSPELCCGNASGLRYRVLVRLESLRLAHEKSDETTRRQHLG
jgi:hypothetical protein